jgi:twitching motility protein PilT
VFRQIPSEILTADQLGIPDSVKKFCTLSKGLVLVTRPRGSGKSTTLPAMIDLTNDKRPNHILAIEDPIEFVHPNKKCLINQREVGKHTNSFNATLRAVLREDPDIVLVGEMWDLETTHIAIETAETGYLVFGTLHTTTAINTVDRFIDQFPSGQQSQIRAMLGDALKGVVAQNLLKKKGGRTHRGHRDYGGQSGGVDADSRGEELADHEHHADGAARGHGAAKSRDAALREGGRRGAYGLLYEGRG